MLSLSLLLQGIEGVRSPPATLSLSLSSSPGHEGLSNPLGLVAPPDVCGGFGWGVKAEFVLPLSLSPGHEGWSKPPGIMPTLIGHRGVKVECRSSPG